jgi:hypothetical protein
MQPAVPLLVAAVIFSMVILLTGAIAPFLPDLLLASAQSSQKSTTYKVFRIDFEGLWSWAKGGDTWQQKGSGTVWLKTDFIPNPNPKILSYSAELVGEARTVMDGMRRDLNGKECYYRLPPQDDKEVYKFPLKGKITYYPPESLPGGDRAKHPQGKVVLDLRQSPKDEIIYTPPISPSHPKWPSAYPANQDCSEALPHGHTPIGFCGGGNNPNTEIDIKTGEPPKPREFKRPGETDTCKYTIIHNAGAPTGAPPAASGPPPCIPADKAPKALTKEEYVKRALGNICFDPQRYAAGSYSVSDWRWINRYITARYAELYIGHPEVFKWAGMAAYASNLVGWGMGRLANVASQLSGSNLQLFYSLQKGNIELYLDIAWQHEVYLAEGMCGIDRMHREGKLANDPQHNDQLRHAWYYIDRGMKEGNQELVWHGNHLLLYYEQTVLLQKVAYGLKDTDPNRKLWKDITNNPLIPTGSPIPKDHATFVDYIKKTYPGLTPDLGDVNQRWDWITKSMLPKFKELEKGTSKVQLDTTRLVNELSCKQPVQPVTRSPIPRYCPCSTNSIGPAAPLDQSKQEGEQVDDRLGEKRSSALEEKMAKTPPAQLPPPSQPTPSPQPQPRPQQPPDVIIVPGDKGSGSSRGGGGGKDGGTIEIPGIDELPGTTEPSTDTGTGSSSSSSSSSSSGVSPPDPVEEPPPATGQ